MLKRLAALALTLALTACATRPPPPPAAPLKVASWNLEFLAQDNGKGCTPRTDADYAKLKLYADRLGADVIAFAEVENATAAARVFDPAKYDILIETRAGSNTPSPCGASSSQMFIRQAVGFAIRKGLTYERRADLTDLQVGNPNLRSGVDIIVKPKAGAPVRLLAVHLKSGCFSGLKGDACATLNARRRCWKAGSTRAPLSPCGSPCWAISTAAWPCPTTRSGRTWTTANRPMPISSWPKARNARAATRATRISSTT